MIWDEHEDWAQREDALCPGVTDSAQQEAELEGAARVAIAIWAARNEVDDEIRDF